MEHPQDPSRNDPAHLLAAIRDICGRFRITSLDRQIEACKGLFVKSPPIDIAILGQFKAGKSSFINSFIGQSILPVGVIPVTTVITRLWYRARKGPLSPFLTEQKPRSVLKRSRSTSPRQRTGQTRRTWRWWILRYLRLNHIEVYGLSIHLVWGASSNTTLRYPGNGSRRWGSPSLP